MFSVKTVCAREYVDNRFNDTKIKEISINNLVGTSYISDIKCLKSGHVVFVKFSVQKADNAETASAKDILSGFPHPIDAVWIHCSPLRTNCVLRGRLNTNGKFGWHYISEWTSTHGHEAVVQFTYLTDD